MSNISFGGILSLLILSVLALGGLGYLSESLVAVRRRRHSICDLGGKTLRVSCLHAKGRNSRNVNKSGGGVPDTGPVYENDDLLGYAIDSFLRGEYDREFAEDAPAPHPGLSPAAVIESVLRSLRRLDDPEPSHGAAVLMRFCLPLSRGDRWGDSYRSNRDSWKEMLRNALTPSMLARRLRASEFSVLLDWTNLDVTEGAYGQQKDLVGVPSIAFVNVALYFGDGTEPTLIQFTLRRIGGVWLIDRARTSPKELFAN